MYQPGGLWRFVFGTIESTWPPGPSMDCTTAIAAAVFAAVAAAVPAVFACRDTKDGTAAAAAAPGTAAAATAAAPDAAVVRALNLAAGVTPLGAE
jgi:hypothetical protein